ncbi:cytospin-A-like [Lolium rigidum]|uniref:cytospin-A-like n=1 Tax=Lolium rigidum TaxID=89674 RepID=UPI001F5CAA22|nr:cytospin-A-like [Lolium rigidum]
MAPDDDKDGAHSRPALPGGADEYVRDSIRASLGLPVPDRSLRLQLLASEDLRRRLQDQVFSLEEDLHAAARRIDLLKKESAMNAEGIRRCVEEKEAVAAARAQVAAQAAKLDKEVTLYERDLERAMESCDDLARENDDLRARLKDAADLTALKNEVQALQRDREILKTNLNKAEEEVKLLFEENRTLDEANKRLLSLLNRSERKHSASNSTKQKRKSSSLKDTSPVSLAIDFNSVDASRHPLSPLPLNSPECRVHKK